MALIGYTITVVAKQDNPYNVLPETDISIRKNSDNTLVNIYADEAGLIPIAQLGAKTDSNGQFTFYADASLGILKAVWTNGGVTSTEVLDKSDHSRLVNRNAAGAHDAIYRRETTVAEIATGVFSDGSKLAVSDLVNARFNVASGGTADNHETISAGVGKTATISRGHEYYSRLQIEALTKSIKKLKNRDIFSVTWYGDSNSARYSAAAQASFVIMMEKAYGAGKINRNGRATSGFTARDAFETYTTDHAGDVSIICYGTNDADFNNYPNTTNIEDYQYWMEALIQRELRWGHPVVLITPVPLRFDKAWEAFGDNGYQLPSDPYPFTRRADVVLMANLMKWLGDRYSIPVIDSSDMMKGFRDESFTDPTTSISSGTPFGDPVHPIQSAIEYWGVKLAAAFIGETVLNKTVVSDGSKLTVRKLYDPIATDDVSNPSTFYKYDSLANQTTFAYGDKIVGNRAIELASGKSLTYAFYCATDELLAVPVVWVDQNSDCDVFIDILKTPPDTMIDTDRDYGVAQFKNRVRIITGGGVTVVNQPSGSLAITAHSERNEAITLNSKGWYTLTIFNRYGTCRVSGVEFRSRARDLISNSFNIFSWTGGDLTLARNGVKYVTGTGAAGLPSGVTSGIFDTKISQDNQNGIVDLIETAPTNGRHWIKTKSAGTWNAWVLV